MFDRSTFLPNPHDANQEPSWRWLRCQYLLEYSRAPFRELDDALTQQAWRFLRELRRCRDAADRELLAERHPLLAAAYQFFRKAPVLKRAEIEARLLAREDDDTIAQKCNLRPSVVAVYHDLLFAVRPNLQADVYIVNRAIGPRAHGPLTLDDGCSSPKPTISSATAVRRRRCPCGSRRNVFMLASKMGSSFSPPSLFVVAFAGGGTGSPLDPRNASPHTGRFRHLQRAERRNGSASGTKSWRTRRGERTFRENGADATNLGPAVPILMVKKVVWVARRSRDEGNMPMRKRALRVTWLVGSMAVYLSCSGVMAVAQEERPTEQTAEAGKTSLG
jgi:hypothetical protein